MQHIAPLQTDLAAKPAGDVTLEFESVEAPNEPEVDFADSDS